MAKILRGINGQLRSLTIDGEVPVANGVDNVSVSFPSPIGNDTYKLTAWLINTVDSNPQFQEVIVTAKSSTGFTAKWNAPTDSANYKLQYIVPDGFIA